MKIILTAGGTGGHIFPAMALACEIREKHPETQLLWITTNRSNEKEIAERFAINILTLDVEGIARKISLKPFKAILKTVKAIVFMKAFIRKEKPDAVIAFGGYVCASVLWAAKSTGVPYFIQEQNTVAGAVNKFFFKGAKKIFLGMPLNNYELRITNYELTGTPVRRKENYDNFEYPQEIDKSRRTVLICGGSQGANSMNKILVKAVHYLSDNNFQVIWQTGLAGESEIKNEFAGDKNIAVFASFTDLYPYYSIAELLIGRAGAGTISEAKLFSLPSIFIPLPWSAENHQWYNAGSAENNGWAIRLEQNEQASDEIISFAEKNLIEKSETYNNMKNNANKNSKNSAEIIVSSVFGGL